MKNGKRQQSRQASHRATVWIGHRTDRHHGRLKWLNLTRQNRDFRQGRVVRDGLTTDRFYRAAIQTCADVQQSVCGPPGEWTEPYWMPGDGQLPGAPRENVATAPPEDVIGFINSAAKARPAP